MADGITTAEDLPHTISHAMLYRARIDSFGELPKDKRPPRNLWDKPYKLEVFLEEIWKTDDKDKKSSPFIEFDLEDVE